MGSSRKGVPLRAAEDGIVDDANAEVADKVLVDGLGDEGGEWPAHERERKGGLNEAVQQSCMDCKTTSRVLTHAAINLRDLHFVLCVGFRAGLSFLDTLNGKSQLVAAVSFSLVLCVCSVVRGGALFVEARW